MKTTRIRHLVPLVMSLFLCTWVVAQEDAANRHRLFLNYLKETAAEISARSLTQIKSLEAWKEQRLVLRQQLFYMLGLDPLPKRTPLDARITGKINRSDYTIEKIVFQSLPGLYVTGNFYVPTRHSYPLPAILYLCGHSPHPLGAKSNYQDRAIWFASNGYACLVLDTLEYGEVAGIHHGIHDLNMWHWLSLGYTPAGTEVWNAIRALDYLESRPEVDRRQIGMTGISGGGAITWYTAAVDERVQAAAPVCSTFTFGSQAAHWVAAGQCDCIYFHNTYLEDFPIVGALIAPRPLIMMSGRKDPDFPPDGYHEVFRKVKGVYDLYAGTRGDSDRVKEIDADVGHSDVPLFLKEARQWMRRWLKNESDSAEVEPVGKETPEDLACLSKLPPDAINYGIHNQLIPVATLKSWPSLAEWNNRRQELLQGLKERTFRWFPRTKARFETKVSNNRGGWAARYADYKDVEFSSESGVRVRAQLLRPKVRSDSSPLLIYVKRGGDSIYFLDLDELLPLLGRFNVLILNPRLTEYPVSAFQYAEIERTASWIGRTTASMQVWDILRAIEWATGEERISPPLISIYGKGEMGILALYAGLFDERVKQVILNDPPSSHWQRPALLNILRLTDIPEVAGAFAPRRIVCLTNLPEAFSYTRKIYNLYGHSTNLGQAGSLPQALEVWNY
jgi:cephalosporin-C deacetylase-like acetyl esterase